MKFPSSFDQILPSSGQYQFSKARPMYSYPTEVLPPKDPTFSLLDEINNDLSSLTNRLEGTFPIRSTQPSIPYSGNEYSYPEIKPEPVYKPESAFERPISTDKIMKQTYEEIGVQSDPMLLG